MSVRVPDRPAVLVYCAQCHRLRPVGDEERRLCRSCTRRETLPPCRHPGCGQPATRRRGLCYRCYENAAIRASYAVLPVFRGGNRDIDHQESGVQPCEPTDALPGSAAKLLVLIARAAACQELWHERDATWEEDER